MTVDEKIREVLKSMKEYEPLQSSGICIWL